MPEPAIVAVDVRIFVCVSNVIAESSRSSVHVACGVIVAVARFDFITNTATESDVEGAAAVPVLTETPEPNAPFVGVASSGEAAGFAHVIASIPRLVKDDVVANVIVELVASATLSTEEKIAVYWLFAALMPSTSRWYVLPPVSVTVSPEGRAEVAQQTRTITMLPIAAVAPVVRLSELPEPNSVVLPRAVYVLTQVYATFQVT